jgi:diphosphomevalonate decarboxylase
MSPLSPYSQLKIESFETSWQSPANIAFVKYWGKKGHQIPANPSVSMTLNKCTTHTKVKFSPNEKLLVELQFEGKTDPKFGVKIHDYLVSLKHDLPWLSQLKVEIETSNTFPHGTGIASSASGLSAFALGVTDYLYHLSQKKPDENFMKCASFLSRLASGSACRSVFGGFSSWGASELAESSDEFATPLTVHPEMRHLLDTVLVISAKEKEVSSRRGHQKMGEHFFAAARFEQAKFHFTKMISALKSGDINTMGDVLEAEALSLHAMMLTSQPAYTLLKPHTLAAIEAIWAFRRDTQFPLYFTLDAGPNLHLIYPESCKAKVETFITHELAPFTQSIIYDQAGDGPLKC